MAILLNLKLFNYRDRATVQAPVSAVRDQIAWTVIRDGLVTAWTHLNPAVNT